MLNTQKHAVHHLAVYIVLRQTKNTMHFGRIIAPANSKIHHEKHHPLMKKNLVRFLLVVTATSLALTSCNVTRTISTQSQYFQKGDTTCTIVTKTIETYDAKKNLAY